MDALLLKKNRRINESKQIDCMSHLPKLTESHSRQEKTDRRNPFASKDDPIRMHDFQHSGNQSSLIETARGNPNWTALAAREAFYALANFAMQECRRDRNNPSGFGGIPIKAGIATRFYKYLQDNKECAGIELLTESYKNGVRYFSPDVEELIIEFVEGVAGTQFSNPTRMLHYCERVVCAYLIQELCGGKQPLKKILDVFAVEGGTAAAHYIMSSLMQNKLLSPGDKVAVAVPIFNPYFELVHQKKFNFDITYIQASDTDEEGNPNYQFPESEIDKLGDKSIKAFFIMDPSNPGSVRIDDRRRNYLVETVKKNNPELIIFTDNTHATFAEGFCSLMNDLPYNTITMYSFSKYFGCSGCNLGVIALHTDNIFDEKIRNLPAGQKKELNELYGFVSTDPENFKFIDRMVADSRNVSLSQVAGLSTPQQIQMALMAAFAIIDKWKQRSAYKRDCLATLQRRYALFWEGMKEPAVDDPNRSFYYFTFDIGRWTTQKYGSGFFEWLNKNFKPLDIISRVVEEYAVVLLKTDNFFVTDWSIRISLANLDSHEYEKLGRTLSNLFEEYVEAWKNDK